MHCLLRQSDTSALDVFSPHRLSETDRNETWKNTNGAWGKPPSDQHAGPGSRNRGNNSRKSNTRSVDFRKEVRYSFGAQHPEVDRYIDELINVTKKTARKDPL